VSQRCWQHHHEYRVITRKLNATQNINEAEKEADIGMLGNRAIQQQAVLAKEGKYEKSAGVGKKWATYLQQNVVNSVSDKESLQSYQQFQVQK